MDSKKVIYKDYEPDIKGETKIKKESEVKKMADEKKFMTREEKVEKFITSHPGISYREAVLKSGIETREDYLSPDEAVRIAGLLDGGISSLNLTKDESVFSEATRKKLNSALRIVTDAKRELELIVEKPLDK